MENILNEITTTAIGLSLLGGAWFVNFLTGVSKYLFNEEKWSWTKFWHSLVKALLMAVAILAIVPVCEGLSWFALQCNCDITALLDGVSVAGVLSGMIAGAIYFLKNAFTNIMKFVNTTGTTVEVKDVNYDEIAEKVYSYFDTPKEVVEAQKEAEAKVGTESGLGQYYSVPIDSYDNFRNTVVGNGYDIDGAYSFQCWDLACLLWTQLGRWLSTGGTGAARGCWTAAKDANAGDDFDLITNKADVKRGDVVVFGCGEYGHIGYADADYDGGAYIKLLGQNQTADMKASVVNVSMSTFLGAFRFKRWEATPEPTPDPTPEPTGKTFAVGDVVVPTELTDYYGTKLRQYDDNYTITQLSGDRAVLCAVRNGNMVVWAAMNTANIRKA